ncbi:tetratricopeptide repeat protein [Paenibacillus pabuli]|uniref:tetratricopeptide repeat protein n=1 Tax=Paenibacillus pabuli TaxID=1472 RepID=UPI00078565FE|nr:tetratricopeptide repeat protein [Paenibacillus pabuli]MEC0126481.1 tetratricopeptide repeat protein [Paenibacillus pabuli]
MKRELLDKAIQLREEGRAKQDQSILAEVRKMLLDLVFTYPDDAEVNFQTGVAHDNSGLGKEAIPFYVRAIEQGLSGPDLERALLGLGSTYRYLGFYQEAEETLRRGVREFPNHRGLQVFLALSLYNMGKYKESTEILLTNLLETTADEKLQYFSRPIKYYAQHLDETWG